MTYTFRKAVRANTTILVGLAGYTGTGKTMSMLRLAEGLRGDGKVLMLDTEAGRGTHYADRFEYDYAEIKPPFSPHTYREAIDQADAAGYRVILLDSMSHEWSGDGGCADMQADALERMAKGDARAMERLTAPAWRDAKIAHKRMMSRLLQCRAHMVFGLRAEPKIKFVKLRDEQTGRDRTVIEDAGYQPICEKSFMFEMTVSFMLNDRHLPEPIKLPDHFKSMFPLTEPITEASGQQLAAWARGGEPRRSDAVGTPASGMATGSPALRPGPVKPALIAEAKRLANKAGLDEAKRKQLRVAHCGGAELHMATEEQLRAMIAAMPIPKA